jgi:hypothetical protein
MCIVSPEASFPRALAVTISIVSSLGSSSEACYEAIDWAVTGFLYWLLLLETPTDGIRLVRHFQHSLRQKLRWVQVKSPKYLPLPPVAQSQGSCWGPSPAMRTAVLKIYRNLDENVVEVHPYEEERWKSMKLIWYDQQQTHKEET